MVFDDMREPPSLSECGTHRRFFKTLALKFCLEPKFSLDILGKPLWCQKISGDPS